MKLKIGFVCLGRSIVPPAPVASNVDQAIARHLACQSHKNIRAIVYYGKNYSLREYPEVTK